MNNNKFETKEAVLRSVEEDRVMHKRDRENREINNKKDKEEEEEEGGAGKRRVRERN